MSANTSLVPKTRAERAREVAELRAREPKILQREIAERLGISRSYAASLINDPDGSADRDRRESYRDPCPKCGNLMTGSEGRGEHRPKQCEVCAAKEARAKKRWTREAIIEAIKLFAERNGRPPVATEWNKTKALRGADYPPLSAIYKYRVGGRGGKVNRAGKNNPFESWADAIEEAGFPRPRRGEYKVRPRKGALRMPQQTRPYLVFKVKDNGRDEEFEIIGITDQPTNDDAIGDLAKEEGDYASVPVANLARRSLVRKLSVVRTEDGHLERQEKSRVVGE